jgi:PAS domain-containing protein
LSSKGRNNLTTQNLKKKKSINHLKNRKRIRLVDDSAIIKPLTAKQVGRLTEEIRALKQQMEFVLGVTKTGLDIIDSEFNIRYIDPEWAKVYGDPTGKKCFEYFMDRSEVCPHCGIPTALETKAATVTEEILVKEGDRPIQVTTIPFQNEKGQWLVAEVNVDISERRRVEEALRRAHEELEIRIQKRTAELARANEAMQAEITEHTQAKKVLRDSEERYRTLTETAQDIIFIIDADDRVQYINRVRAKTNHRKTEKGFFPISCVPPPKNEFANSF